MTKKRAENQVNKAIDAMIALQDGGYGCDTVQRILDMLNPLRNRIEDGTLQSR